MKVMTSKSKNSESFYIAKSYINNEGRSTSKIIRKLGTLLTCPQCSILTVMVSWHGKGTGQAGNGEIQK